MSMYFVLSRSIHSKKEGFGVVGTVKTLTLLSRYYFDYYTIYYLVTDASTEGFNPYY